MGLRVEPVGSADLESCLTLLRAAGLPEEGVAEGFARFLKISDGAIAVGFAGLEVHGGHGLLRSVVVDETRRGEGLGVRLVEAASAQARALGLQDLYLLTTTARAFFLGHGFRDVPRDEAPETIRESWEFRSGCPASSAFMRRTL
jgi:amino-acid N-acetyltransferase